MIVLSLNETRVLGVLFEKERTTPDIYPLSLNALTSGCNQKSNRDPVLQLTEGEVQVVLDSLIEKKLVTEVVLKSRVSKYRQRFGSTQFSHFNVSLKEQSILMVLFLRGPQTPGELRARTSRLCEFDDVNEVERVLQDLMERSNDAYVVKLPREPGKRESRYAHLFSGEVNVNSDDQNHGGGVSAGGNDLDACIERIEALEQCIQELRGEVDVLKQCWQALNE